MGIGPLANYTNDSFKLNNIKVSHFLNEGRWNEVKVRQHAPILLVPQILQTMIHYQEDTLDEAMWKLIENGLFIIASS